MALSNRDRIGKTFELIAPPLDAFISDAVAPKLPQDWAWIDLVKFKDEAAGKGGSRDYHALDPQVQLRMLTEGIAAKFEARWYPFDGKLSRPAKGWAEELRTYRNEWAHNKAFSDDEAYRCLDTAERLMGAIGAADAADGVREIRLGLRRLTAEKDDKKVLKAAAVAPGSSGLRPWREVLKPHEDVATGNFHAAEFAADLHKVAATEEDDRDYAEPVQFFARTYLTEGLQDLIGRSVRRISGDQNASPVINLQTNFGGGKTHSMLALWHLASGTPSGEYTQELQELLSETPFAEIESVRRVALVGNHLSPSGAVKPDGTSVNTIWGELAWQLGGPEGFAMVAKADADRTPPGEALHELLAAYSPALILIDEWVAYARSLVNRDDLAGGTFDDQFTFAQALTEAVKGTPGALLAISIPASERGDDTDLVAGNAEEVGGEYGIEALKRLQNVVRRVADQWRPASSNEAYRIVRQRLFDTPDAEAWASINATAQEFVGLYVKNKDEFPQDAYSGAYEDRIKDTYPIHPEFFDRLYEDWSSLERFQRTRGVLRLMNEVIHALWAGGDQAPLIMPGSIPLESAKVNSELTQYLQDSWKSVIDADVAGSGSEPDRIDSEKTVYGQRSLTKRLARTVFFGAAPTIGTAHKGLERQRVFLGTAMPGDTLGNFHSALTALSDRATYFYNAGGRYWYDLQANISRRAKDMADGMALAEVHAELTQRLKAQAKDRGAFTRVHGAPEDSGDILDLDEARLVLVHPSYAHKRGEKASEAIEFAWTAAERHGTGNRTYRNMVVFLAADQSRLEELVRSIREYLGWSQVLVKEDELNLAASQRRQAQERQKSASETSDRRLLEAYQWLLVPTGQPIVIDAKKVEGGDSLAGRVTKRMGSDATLSTKHVGQAIRHQLNSEAARLWESGHVSVGDLWRLYAEYPYMPRLRDRAVFEEGLVDAPMFWDQDGYALADGYDDEKGRYHGLVLPEKFGSVSISDATLLVKPEAANEQIAAEGPGPELVDDDGGGDDGGDDGTDDDGLPKQMLKRRYFGSKQLDAERYASDFKKLADEVLAPLGQAPGVEIRVTVEIEAISTEGFDDAKVRTVSENASTLKFEETGFEEQ